MAPPNEALYQVTAPYFCAGIVAVAGQITEAAPILRWARGKTVREFKDYCQRKGWKVQEVSKWQKQPEK